MDRTTQTSEGATINYLTVAILTVLGLILALGGQFAVERFTQFSEYSWLVPLVVWGLGIFFFVFNENTFMRRTLLIPLSIATLETIPVVLLIAIPRIYLEFDNITFVMSMVMGIYFFFRLMRAVHPFFHVGESLVYSDHSAVRMMNQKGKPEEGKRIVVRDFKKFKEEVEKTLPREPEKPKVIPFSAKGPVVSDTDIGMDAGSGFSSPDEMWSHMENISRTGSPSPVSGDDVSPPARPDIEKTEEKMELRKARSEALWGSLQVSKKENQGQVDSPGDESSHGDRGAQEEWGGDGQYYFSEDFRQITEGDDIATRSREKISLDDYQHSQEFPFAEDFRNQMVKESDPQASSAPADESGDDDDLGEPEREMLVDDRKEEDLPIYEALGINFAGEPVPANPQIPVMPQSPPLGFVPGGTVSQNQDETFDFEALLESRHGNDQSRLEEKPQETPRRSPVKPTASPRQEDPRPKAKKKGFGGIRHVEEAKTTPRRPADTPPPPRRNTSAPGASRSPASEEASPRRGIDFTSNKRRPIAGERPSQGNHSRVRENKTSRPPAGRMPGKDPIRQKPGPDKWQIIRTAPEEKKPQQPEAPKESTPEKAPGKKPSGIPAPPVRGFVAPVSSGDLFSQRNPLTGKRPPFIVTPPKKMSKSVPATQGSPGNLPGIPPNIRRLKPVKASELWKKPQDTNGGN